MTHATNIQQTSTQTSKMKIIIAGAGAVGTHLAKLMSRDHEDCVLLDDDAARLEEARQRI